MEAKIPEAPPPIMAIFCVDLVVDEEQVVVVDRDWMARAELNRPNRKDAETANRSAIARTFE
jgi:hypothetical protein